MIKMQSQLVKSNVIANSFLREILNKAGEVSISELMEYIIFCQLQPINKSFHQITT